TLFPYTTLFRSVEHEGADTRRLERRVPVDLRLAAERDVVRALREADVGVHEALHGALDIGCLRALLGVRRAAVVDVRNLHAEEMPGLQVVGEAGIRFDLRQRGRAAGAAAGHLEVPLHRADDRRDPEDREARREPVL